MQALLSSLSTHTLAQAQLIVLVIVHYLCFMQLACRALLRLAGVGCKQAAA